MKKKIAFGLIGIVTLLGLFVSGNTVSADSATTTCTSATLYGTVTPNGASTQAWFEWGPTPSVAYATPKQTFNSNSSFSQVLSPLPENTTFYFRAMASNANGTAAGQTLSFKTTCNTPPPAPNLTVSLTADQTSIAYNGSTTLRWSTNVGATCNGSGGTNGWSGSKSSSGTFQTQSLTNSQTYSITCYATSTGQQANDSVTVNVGNQPVQTCQDSSANNYGGALPCRYTNVPTVNISADQSSVSYNGATIIRWSSTNATACNGTSGVNGWSGNKSTSGSFSTGALTNNVSFNISCTNASGSASDSVTVSVGNQPAQTCQDHNANNYGGALPCRYNTQTCQDPSANNYGGALPCTFSNIVNVDLTADNYNINSNGGTVLRWSSNNATSCSGTGGLNGWSGSKSTSGSFSTGALSATKTFGITCTNANGNSSSDSVTITVSNNDTGTRPTVNITADERNIDDGDSTRIRWDSTNADSCNASDGTNGWSGNRSTSGSFNTGALTRSVTYSITCRNDQNGLTGTDSVTIDVDASNDNTNRPNVTISADRTNLSTNNNTTIRWYTSGADSCNASGGTNGWSGSKSTSGGSFSTGSITSTTTFSINCSNNKGSDSDSVTIYVNNDNSGGNNTSTLTAITTAATQISNSSAQLNSLIFTSGTNTSAWFEWGANSSFGFSTNRTNVGSVSSTTNSATINGLVPGVTYYFRAVAEDSVNRSYGNTMSFTMVNLGGTVAGSSNTTVIRPTTIINRGGGVAQSLIMLTIDGGSENISPLERRNYQVTWRNISGQTLRNVVLRVIVPQSMVFEGANKGSFSNRDNTLTLELGDLSPNETDQAFVLASAKGTIINGELIVTVANMVYTEQSGGQGDATAYATQRADLSGSVLGANAFGAGFLPNSFLGWLLLLILLLLILLLSRYLYNQFKEPKQTIMIER